MSPADTYPSDPNGMTDDQAIKLFTSAFSGLPRPLISEERKEWGQTIRKCLKANDADEAVQILINDKWGYPVETAFNLLAQARAHQVKPAWMEP